MINIRMQPQEMPNLSPKITVIGVGGAGGNAVNNMIGSNLGGVEFLVCNTDAQAIQNSIAPRKVQMGVNITSGLGAGARPEIGRAAAEESLEEILMAVEGSNMVFITAGMGGGTGTGAAPVIAEAIREQGILTVGVVTKPFHFEGQHRMRSAEGGIDELQDHVDTLIVIPNQNLFRIANEKTTFSDAFKLADGVLQSGVRGVTDLMVMDGLINLDFADIRSAMMEMGKALMGTGEAMGDKRAVEAAEQAINNPLLDDVSMKGARGVIINITGGLDMTLFEVDEACNRIRDEVDQNANIIFGSTFDETLEGTMRVSIVATGIDADVARQSTTTTSSSVAPKVEAPKVDVSKSVQDAPVKETISITSQASVFQNTPVEPQQSAPIMPQQQTSYRMEPAADPIQEAPSYHSMQAAAPRPQQQEQSGGFRYGDTFIPPAPREAAQPTQPVQKTQMQTEMAMSEPAPVMEEPLQPEKRTPSLFERITGTGRRTEQPVSEPQQQTQMDDSLRATPSSQAAPQQGSLNIEASPSRPRLQKEDDLDVPAFLRRQAN